MEIKRELYDTKNLRINAGYEIEVAKDVYWVPVNQLGYSNYTNDDIQQMLHDKPEEKQEKITTLYEAVQLYQLGNFRGVIDNHKEGGWDIHKPGYHAVRTNEGCCASDSNWLSYLLYEKYEQMGFIHYSQSDGNGHIMNYIFHNGWYYFIDMMMYRSDSLPYAGIETGTSEGYKDKELIAGNFFKSKSPISYVNFCLLNHKNSPIFFTISMEREVRGIKLADNRKNHSLPLSFDVYHPLNTKIMTLYKDKDFPLSLKFEKEHECNPCWEDIPTFIFK